VTLCLGNNISISPAASGRISTEMNVMKLIVAVIAILVLSSFANSQSGRRAKEIKTPVPPQPQEVIEPKPKAASEDGAPPVTAERNQDYRCVLDGGLERIIEPENVNETIVSAKEADSRAEMTAKPKPSYTKEARRIGVQGFVTLRVLLSASGKISRVRVVKGLRAGLTENAIRAACKIEFKPAMKNGQPVAQWVTAEYVFRLADSSIFAP
jgi:TonB family protein